jgi:flagellar biosynthesis protein FlhG
LALTSGKGGVGKTFLAANLAAALAQRGERVLVLDADLGLANLDVVLNLSPKLTLHDVFTGKAVLEDAILPAPGGFSVLLAGSGLVEYSRLTPEVREQLQRVIETLAPRFDRILLDTGAGISDVVLYAVSLADEVLVIATPEPTSMTDAYATIKVLATQQARREVGLVVNEVGHAGQGRVIHGQLQLVVDRFVAPLLDPDGRARSGAEARAVARAAAGQRRGASRARDCREARAVVRAARASFARGVRCRPWHSSVADPLHRWMSSSTRSGPAPGPKVCRIRVNGVCPAVAPIW